MRWMIIYSHALVLHEDVCNMQWFSMTIPYKCTFCFMQKKTMRTSSSSLPLHVHVNENTPVHVHVKKGMKNSPIKPAQVSCLLLCRNGSNENHHQYLVLCHIQTVSTSYLLLLLQVKAKGCLRPIAKVKTRVPWIPPGKASTREALYKWEVRRMFIMYALLKDQFGR